MKQIRIEELKEVPHNNTAWQNLFLSLRDLVLPSMWPGLQEADRADISADAVCEILKRIQSVNCRSYFNSVVRSSSRKFFKGQARHRRLSDDDLRSAQYLHHLRSCSDTYVGEATQRESSDYDRIGQMFGALPPRDQHLLANCLRHMRLNPADHRESLAAELGVKVGTLNVRLHRVFQKLRKRLVKRS